jgi:prefoldin subunit 5
MNVITKLIRVLLAIPLVIFVSPALLLLMFAIIVFETQEGTLRELFWLEVKAYGLVGGFKRFMQKIFIPTYKNSVQGFVLGGAGFLVMSVGLRSLGVIPTDYVYVALGVEFMLLLIWGIMTYYTPLEQGVEGAVHHEVSSSNILQSLSAGIKELNRQLGLLEARMKTTESKQDHFSHIQVTLQTLVQKIETVLGANPELHALKESNEKISGTMKELAAQLALLESRLRSTEAKFDAFNQLDGTLRTLTQRIELIVGDQFNVRVKNEFEQLLAEMSGRLSPRRSQQQ